MPRRRFISTSTSVDRAVNRLAVKCSDFAALLYIMMIPHAEDDATLTGDPEELLATIWPMRRDKDEQDVIAALEAMASPEIGLIERWDREGGVIYLPPDSFYRYQTYVPTSKRRKPGVFTRTASAAEISEDEGQSARFSAQSRESAKNSENQRRTARNAATRAEGEGEGEGKEKLGEEKRGGVGERTGSYDSPMEPDPFTEDYDPKREHYLDRPRPSRRPTPKAALSDAECVAAGEARFPAAIAWVLWKCQTEARCPAPWLPYRRKLWEQIAAGEIPPSAYEDFTIPGTPSAPEAKIDPWAIPPGATTRESTERENRERDEFVRKDNELYLRQTATELGVDFKTLRMFTDQQFEARVAKGEYRLRNPYTGVEDEHWRLREFARFLGLETYDKEFWLPLQQAAAGMAA